MRLSILNLSKSTRNTKKSAIKLNAHIPSHYLKTVLYSVKIKIFPSKIHTFFLIEKKGGSPCLFKRKRAFISMSSSAWGKSLTLSRRKRWCARANDAKIVRSKDSQCNTFLLGNHLRWPKTVFPRSFQCDLARTINATTNMALIQRSFYLLNASVMLFFFTIQTVCWWF